MARRATCVPRASGSEASYFVTSRGPAPAFACWGGDFNETPDGLLDRAVSSPEGSVRGSPDGSYTVRKVLRRGTDVYRHAHPLTHEEALSGVSSERQGHSYFQAHCGSSRIDLSLVFPPLRMTGGVLAFVDDERLSDGLDYRPVCFMIPLSAKKAAVPRCPPPWKVKTLFVNDITDEQADALERAVNVAVRSVLLRWYGPLASVCVDSESAAAVLQGATSIYFFAWRTHKKFTTFNDQ